MPKTYNDIYFETRNKLRESGVDAASLEAKIIVAAAAGKTTEQLVRDMYLYTSDDIEKKAEDMLSRRLAGEPIAYISGQWEFYGLPINVTRDVLIPRMDTELLAGAAIEALKHRDRSGRVLDLCCGSGCIACAVAHEVPTAGVVAADISSAALEVCRRNVSLNGLSPRVITMRCDAAAWPPVSIGSFDVIVSNPPYIRSDEIIELDCSVRDYEPVTALDGGEDGLDFYRAIIKYWPITLRPNGFMMFEVGEGQAGDVRDMLYKAGFVAVTSLKDTLGFERVVIGRWKNEY